MTEVREGLEAGVSKRTRQKSSLLPDAAAGEHASAAWPAGALAQNAKTVWRRRF